MATLEFKEGVSIDLAGIVPGDASDKLYATIMAVVGKELTEIFKVNPPEVVIWPPSRGNGTHFGIYWPLVPDMQIEWDIPLSDLVEEFLADLGSDNPDGAEALAKELRRLADAIAPESPA